MIGIYDKANEGRNCGTCQGHSFATPPLPNFFVGTNKDGEEQAFGTKQVEVYCFASTAHKMNINNTANQLLPDEELVEPLTTPTITTDL